MQAKSQSTPAKPMSKMHSWPPMEQGIERPMSDMAPMFSAPALPWGPGLPKTLCPVPKEDPMPRPAALAKTGSFLEAPVGPADLENQRQTEELRRVLRAMYKTHFRMETDIWCACGRPPSHALTCASSPLIHTIAGLDSHFKSKIFVSDTMGLMSKP